MPSKCRTCNKVTATPCNELGKECVIVKCATIHYLSTNGTGLLRGTSRRAGTVLEQDETREVERTRIEHIQLKRVCSSLNKMDQSTFYKPLITCPDCLVWIAANEPEPTIPEPVINTQTLSQLTTEEKQALSEVNSGVDKTVLNI